MRQEQVFRSSKVKTVLHVVGASLFVWGGIHMIASRPLIGWLAVLLFGACALAGIALLVTGGASIRLDKEGFELVGTFKRSRILWKDIEAIHMAKIRGASVIALNYRSGDPRRSQVSRSLAGIDTAIGNIYNVPLKDLCATLKEWHERHRSAT